MSQDVTHNAFDQNDDVAIEAFSPAWNTDKISTHLTRAMAQGYTDLFYVNSVIGDGSLLNVIKAIQEVCDCGFPCTCASDKRNFLPRFCIQADI